MVALTQLPVLADLLPMPAAALAGLQSDDDEAAEALFVERARREPGLEGTF